MNEVMAVLEKIWHLFLVVGILGFAACYVGLTIKELYQIGRIGQEKLWVRVPSVMMFSLVAALALALIIWPLLLGSNLVLFIDFFASGFIALARLDRVRKNSRIIWQAKERQMRRAQQEEK